jgi:RimJ/RimL family protein N-acetyltransferase
MADPRVWRHFPSGVHTSPDRTAEQLAREERSWELDGLGYWSVRLRGRVSLRGRESLRGRDSLWGRDALRGRDSTFAGVGGCRLYATAAWNLYYRIRPELQGNGYATELATAAIGAARMVDPGPPIVASVLAHNAASRAVATKVGLRLVWEGTEPAGRRLLFCDRDIDPAALAALHAR